MSEPRVAFRIHAIQRMFERRISSENVKRILKAGETIEDFPEDQPYPSRLMFGRVGKRPFHVVAATNSGDNEAIVITVYKPDPNQWRADFRSRKR